MSPQRYEVVNSHDDDGDDSPITSHPSHPIPSSPPPSFRSRASSPTSRRLLSQDPLGNNADHDLDDAFDNGEDSDAENEGDDRQRLMRADTGRGDSTNSSPIVESAPSTLTAPRIERRVTQLPSFTPAASGRAVNRPTNDGVFANLAAKPTVGEQSEEKPPSYEQAAADATPPYWETTVLAPGMSADEVYVDGLPVGSLFSFIWNGMISTSFQLVGFLLTYLLHTTHAAKNGSRAGLGLTLVQYGFFTGGSSGSSGADAGTGDPNQFAGTPSDPNSHNFDPGNVNGGSSSPQGGSATTHMGLTSSDWISYILMIVGWFILIRSVVDFLRVKRHERMVLESPNRGLPVPIVVAGESPETAA